VLTLLCFPSVVGWIGMETTTPQPVCAQEALELLNCAAASPYDRDKCLALLDALRDCIAHKVLPLFHLSLIPPSVALPSTSLINGKFHPLEFSTSSKVIFRQIRDDALNIGEVSV
jgi:hypothetical protein